MSSSPRPRARKILASGRSNKAPKSANKLWSDEELRESISVYVLLLRMQINGLDQKSEPVAQALLSGPLALRNDASIRYRMRNISAVARELGSPTLKDFSPAESVGANVRPRIRAMLLEHPDFARVLNPVRGSPRQDRQDALAALAILRDRIEDLERELSWVGHNQPPESINAPELKREEFRQALSDIDTLQIELEKPQPDTAKVERSRSRLAIFGATLAKWLGGRATKFTDAALVAAAPVVVAKVSGLLPTIVSALEGVARALGP